MPFVVTIDRRSFALGTCVAVVMAGVLMRFSSGWSLVVANMPALVFAWAIFAWMHLRRHALPSAGDVIPIYFIAMAVYFIQFAEQFTTGFAARFAALYGGDAYTSDQFVVFTMASAAFFTLTCLAVFLRCATFLLVPVLFFALNAIYANAIAQTWWSLEVQGYFPGLVTSLVNWFLGPILIAIMLRSFRVAALVMVLLAAVLIASLSTFQV
jgi:hypothetical protein